MKNILGQFRLEDFLNHGDHDFPAPEGTVWEGWIAGHDPEIDPEFAWECFSALCAAKLCFSDDVPTPPDTHGPLMAECLAYTRDLLADLDEAQRGPFSFGNEVDEREFIARRRREPVHFTKKQVCACYTFYFLDQAIRSLFAGDCKGSTKFAFYGATMAQYQYGTEPRHEQQRNAAIVRHQETNQLKEEVQAYWRAHIDPTVANDAAARLLVKIFPLGPRTLAQYVKEAKDAPGEQPPGSI